MISGEHAAYEIHEKIEAYLTDMRNREQLEELMAEFDRRSGMSSNQCNRLVEKLIDYEKTIIF